MIGNGGASGTDGRLLYVRVTTTDGRTTIHIYPLRETEVAQREASADRILLLVRDSFTRTTPLLRLANPDVLYNPDQVVRVALDVVEVEVPVDETEERGPIGFRPP